MKWQTYLPVRQRFCVDVVFAHGFKTRKLFFSKEEAEKFINTPNQYTKAYTCRRLYQGERYKLADIAMCHGENCDIRENCYRYTAPINEYWQPVLPKTPTKRPCDKYWDNTGYYNGKTTGHWWRCIK